MTARRLVLLCGLVLGSLGAARAQDEIRINQDESRVPAYVLPDPLTNADGTKVADRKTWLAKRRPELLGLFREHVYGVRPGNLDDQATFLGAELTQPFESDTKALGGKATRRQFEVVFRGSTADPATGKPRILKVDLLVYTPNGVHLPPVFMGYNFNGNHAVHADPQIRLNDGWIRDEPKGSHPGNRATEKNRGEEASRWAIERAIDRGCGVATLYYGDIDPDFDDGFENGLHGIVNDRYAVKPPWAGDAWGSISAWAMGLKEVAFLLHKLDIHSGQIILLGHSRLGKAALWAAAQDNTAYPTFAGVISNQSGCGGAALSKRDFGETVRRINTSFPHWFCDNFEKYNDNEAALPVDQHELLATIAPLPVLVCSAEDDKWADPKGEYLSCVAADPAYRLVRGEGLEAREMPKPNERVWGRLMYHIRPGKHDVTADDWDLYLDWADRYVKKK